MDRNTFNNLKDNISKLEYILDTEEGLKIPPLRRKDYMWLLRNFSINNSEHPMYNLIMQLLRAIAIEQLKKNK